MKKIIYGAAALLVLASCQTGKEKLDAHHFDNKLYINAQELSEEILVKPGLGDVTRTLSLGTALQADEDITGRFVADTALVDTYRTIWMAPDVVPLPLPMCTIENPEVTLRKGSNASTEATVVFSGMDTLNRKLTYVMPVTLKDTGRIEVLKSKTTVYYVFKGAALINVVCNMANNRAAASAWKTPEKFTNMSHFTAEALVRQNAAGRLISTIMGVEGHYLLRIGDAGVPDTQLQIASSSNQTNSNMTLALGQWTHIACVFDEGRTTVYFNGKKVLDKANSGRSSVTWGAYGSDKGETTGSRYFWLGYSYAQDRYFDGEMAEVRVWDHCLSAEEINADNHFYTVSPSSEGIIAYWKLDDGAGTILKDSSPNGNDLTLDNPAKWPKVSLPEAE